MFLQFLINGLITGSLFALLAMAFSFTYNTTKIFSIAYAGVLVAACFFHYFFIVRLKTPFIVALILTLTLSGILNSIIEKLIYQKLESKGSSHNGILVASIGLFIILINLFAMVLGNENKSFSQDIQNSMMLDGIVITKIQLYQVFISSALIMIIFGVLNRTSLGLKIKAISFDFLLFQVLGNDSKRLRLILYFFSGVLGAVVSLLMAYDVGFDPYFGMNLFLNALLAMIIGGFGSFKGAFIGGLVLGILQSLSIYFFEARWETTISFSILILILIFRPQGIFGVKQRWI